MKYLMVPLMLMACSGCATQQIASQPIPDSRAYSASFDKTWGALISVLAERGLDIETSDKSSGLLTTRPYALASASKSGGPNVPTEVWRVAYKPFSMFGMWNSVEYKLNVLVTQEEAGSKVKITTRIDVEDGSGLTHQLKSRGVIEDEIFTAMGALVK